jgi:hypothetical protein
MRLNASTTVAIASNAQAIRTGVCHPHPSRLEKAIELLIEWAAMDE